MIIRIDRMEESLQRIQISLRDQIFNLNNTYSVQAYIEPGKHEVEFVIDRNVN